MLLHHFGQDASCDPNPPPLTRQFPKGTYRSANARNWTPFNTGNTVTIDATSKGSLAVDGVRAFMATGDGKVWYVDLPAIPDAVFHDGYDAG